MNELLYRVRRFLFQEFTPITKGIVAFTAVFFFLNLLLGFLGLNHLLKLNPEKAFWLPWTLLTYPLVNLDFLSLFFGLLWFWSVGGNIERNFGIKMYSFFLSTVTITTGLVIVVTERLLVGSSYQYQGIWLLLTGVTWAWARLHPYQDTLLFGLIPMRAKWMAWLVAGLTFSSYVRVHPLIAIATLSGIPIVYLFTDYGSWSGGFYSKGYKQNRNGANGSVRLKQRRSRLRVIK